MRLPINASNFVPTLANSGDMLSIVFQECPLPMIAVRKASGIVCEANRAILDLTGLEKPDIVGWRASDLDIWDSAIRSLFEPGTEPLNDPALLRQQRVRTANGIWQTCNVGVYPTYHASELLLLVVVRDLANSDEAQTLQKHNLLAASLEDMPVGIYIAHSDLSFGYCNDTLAEMFGFTNRFEYQRHRSDPPVGLSMFYPDGRPVPIHELPIAQAIAGKRGVGVEYMIRRRDTKRMVSCATTFAPIRDAMGSTIGGVVIMRDNDERRSNDDTAHRYRVELERQVKRKTAELAAATATAETANRSKTLFLRNVSHEMRTPLNAISVVTALLKNTNLTDKQTEIIDKLQTASQQLIELINLLLDINQIEEGRLFLQQERFTMRQIIDTAYALTSDTAVAKGLTLTYDINGEDREFLGDSRRLKQMLLNYVSNALKFTNRGRIEVQASCSRTGNNQSLLRFEVRDTGIGIADTDLGRLFQPFEQMASPLRGEVGSGLGLAITRRLSTQMGGDTGAESELGKGSVFWFTAKVPDAPLRDLIPASDIVPTQERSDSEAAVRLPNTTRPLEGRILLVEDDRMSRQLLSTLLAHSGLSVDTAEDGVDAIKKSMASRYHLILMDMQMPNMDGPTAAAAISAQRRDYFLPIVALTANAFEVDRERCTEAGMCDFISKPVSPQDLFDRVAHWLARSSAEHNG